MDLPIPVLDNHMHCDPRNGKGLEAIKKFDRSGGTHLCMINKPSWHLEVEPEEGEDYRQVFEETLGVVEGAREIVDGDVFPILGVHPAVISRLAGADNSYSNQNGDRDVGDEESSSGSVDPEKIEKAETIMKEGLVVASEYVEDGRAIGLKSGRPHYDVSDEVWEASNRVMKHAFELGAELGCAVQLHTEYERDLSDIARLARDAGIDTDRVVKHYSPPDVDGVVPSVMSNKEEIEKAVEKERDFFMETDYVDDNDRPGAVLGIRTVPRRVRHFLEKADDDERYEEAMYRAHVEMPEKVYGVEMDVR